MKQLGKSGRDPYATDFLMKLTVTPTVGNARVFVSLENFFSHDKYTGGVNPEAQNTNVSGNGSYGVSGDYGSMPLSKTASIGVNFSF